MKIFAGDCPLQPARERLNPFSIQVNENYYEAIADPSSDYEGLNPFSIQVNENPVFQWPDRPKQFRGLNPFSIQVNENTLRL